MLQASWTLGSDKQFGAAGEWSPEGHGRSSKIRESDKTGWLCQPRGAHALRFLGKSGSTEGCKQRSTLIRCTSWWEHSGYCVPTWAAATSDMRQEMKAISRRWHPIIFTIWPSCPCMTPPTLHNEYNSSFPCSYTWPDS